MATTALLNNLGSARNSYQRGQHLTECRSSGWAAKFKIQLAVEFVEFAVYAFGLGLRLIHRMRGAYMLLGLINRAEYAGCQKTIALIKRLVAGA